MCKFQRDFVRMCNSLYVLHYVPLMFPTSQAKNMFAERYLWTVARPFVNGTQDRRCYLLLYF